VFASGFNMQRGDFFGNIRNILLFGVFGTFVAFGSFSGLTIALKNSLTLYMNQRLEDGSYESKELFLENKECLLFCSLMCSSDVVAAISLVSYEKDPALYSVVFGEGITNDAVSIILF